MRPLLTFQLFYTPFRVADISPKGGQDDQIKLTLRDNFFFQLPAF